jgi:hypothetical protein
LLLTFATPPPPKGTTKAEPALRALRLYGPTYAEGCAWFSVCKHSPQAGSWLHVRGGRGKPLYKLMPQNTYIFRGDTASGSSCREYKEVVQQQGDVHMAYQSPPRKTPIPGNTLSTGADPTWRVYASLGLNIIKYSRQDHERRGDMHRGGPPYPRLASLQTSENKGRAS